MNNKKLTNVKTKRTVEFKAYNIGEIPKSFNKYTDLYFNKNGLTYIEKVESFWDHI